MDTLSTARLVLVEPEGPANLGAIARLVTNYGLSQWSLVSPKCSPTDPQALQFAVAHSKASLDAASVHSTLEEALSGCTRIIGFCGVSRPKSSTHLPWNDAIARIDACAKRGERVALVFGNERVGLSSDDLDLCTHRVMLPTASTLSSLNLSHAVSVVLSRLYEEHQKSSQPKDTPATDDSETRLAASFEERALLYDHWRQALETLGFHTNGNPERLLRIYRRALERAHLSQAEVAALRAFLKEIKPFERR